MYLANFTSKHLPIVGCVQYNQLLTNLQGRKRAIDPFISHNTIRLLDSLLSMSISQLLICGFDFAQHLFSDREEVSGTCSIFCEDSYTP